MTNTPYTGGQTPSSMPPEPPYRTGETADTNVQGYTVGSSSDQASVQPSGNGYAGKAPTDATLFSAPSSVAYESTSSAAFSAPSGGTEPLHQPEDPYKGQHVAQNQPSQSFATNAYHQTDGAAVAQKSGGAGKTFLFGFLGALVACALALGAFFIWNSNQSATSISTQVGAADSSVINAVEEGQSLAEAVAAKALPSVVAVYNYQRGASSSYGLGITQQQSTELSPAGMGSGVIISQDGYILTNYHVVQDADSLKVTIGGEERDATYVGGDQSSDIAVVKVDDTEGLVPVDIGNSDDLVIGEWVMTIGAPLGLEQSVATGVVSATNRSTMMDARCQALGGCSNQTPEVTYYPNMIQTDAVINPGNSGGALVDADGKLIGINTMISSYSGDYAGVGFAIPVNYAVGIATDIINGKTPTHAILGVSISNVNSQIAKRYGFSATSGAYINAITPGTGAADSGLEVGDIITAIDGTEVGSVSDVVLAVRSHNVGQTVTVTVDRNGQTSDVDVVLSSDENVVTSEESEPQNQNQNNNGNGGSDNSNEYNMRNLEELLRMFGM